jgi:hypothetical protein
MCVLPFFTDNYCSNEWILPAIILRNLYKVIVVMLSAVTIFWKIWSKHVYQIAPGYVICALPSVYNTRPWIIEKILTVFKCAQNSTRDLALSFFSVCALLEQVGSHSRFSWSLMFDYYVKNLLRKFKFHQSLIRIACFAPELCTYMMIPCSILHRMRNVLEVLEKVKTLFWKPAVCDSIGKYSLTGHS